MIVDTRDLARKLRIHALTMTSTGGSSHVGSAMSCADILAVLYGAILKFRPQDPAWADRDRFILSKGHAGCVLYAALAETGFFSIERLKTHYQDGSDLSGHVSHLGIPGVEISTGSLGHGLPIAGGMALAAKRAGKSQRVFVLLSDGECDEGSTWEAILFASHHKLDNLVAIVDYNKMQSLGLVCDTLALEPFSSKWEAFGWAVREAPGHDHVALTSVFDSIPYEAGKPTCVLAHTIKGKGVSFMENSVLWHYRTACGNEYAAALCELEGQQ
jgi:transketolase